MYCTTNVQVCQCTTSERIIPGWRPKLTGDKADAPYNTRSATKLVVVPTVPFKIPRSSLTPIADPALIYSTLHIASSPGPPPAPTAHLMSDAAPSAPPGSTKEEYDFRQLTH